MGRTSLVILLIRVGIMIVKTGFGACCLCRDVMMNAFQMKHLERDSSGLSHKNSRKLREGELKGNLK